MEIRQNIDQLIVAERIAVDERCAFEQSGNGRRRPQRANRVRGTLLETLETAHGEEAFGGVRQWPEIAGKLELFDDDGVVLDAQRVHVVAQHGTTLDASEAGDR